MAKVDAISPVGLTGHTGVKLNETMVLITGGVNEHIFDKYFIDIAAADESEKIKSSIIILINLPKIIF